MKKFFGNMKIARKLMVSYLLACIVPLLISSIVLYKVSVQKLEENAIEFASIFSSQIVFNMENFVKDYDQLTMSVLVDSEPLDFYVGDTIHDQINMQLHIRKMALRLMTLQPEIQGVSYLTEKNHLVFYVGNTGASINGELLKQQEWLQKMQEKEDILTISAIHDKSYYDRSYYDNKQSGIALTVGRKIMDYTGEYVGMLLLDLEPSSLIQMSDQFLLARNQYNIKINITNADNEILYDSDVASGQLTWGEVQEQNSDQLDQRYSDDYLIYSQTAKNADLSVNIIIPRSTLFFKVSRIGYVALSLAIISLIVIFISSFSLSRGITKPIRDLQKQMKQMEKGNYDVMTAEDSKDELGDLIRSYNRMVLKIKSLIEEVYIAEIEQKNAKYLALQAQINPHMLFNTLESIRLKALMSGADEAADMLLILAKMFRVSLNSSTGPHRIRDEIEYTENYIKLQNLRYLDMFSLNVDVENDILNESIVLMVLQPVVENCIKHGFKGYGNPLHITLKGWKDEAGRIFLQIGDDGKGISDERAEEINRILCNMDKTMEKQNSLDAESGIGLKNIAERIKLHYGDTFYLKVLRSEKFSALIEICIPS